MTLPGDQDTIVAVATPAGRGGVAVVRMSGRDARRLAGSVVKMLPEARRAGLRLIRDGCGRRLDRGHPELCCRQAGAAGD